MTTFNDGALLRQSIDSVLNQSYGDFELLLVDDGSSSPTTDILESIVDPRVKLLPQSNDGLSSARNRGLQHAGGDYICFLDADDTRAPWSFEQAASVIAESRPDLILTPGVHSLGGERLKPFMDQVCFSAMEAEVDQSGPLSLDQRKVWAMNLEPQSANKFLSRELVERGSLRFPNDHFFEDILFHILAVSFANSIEFLSSPGFTYFQRQFRPQLTGSNGSIRFDILGSVRVAFQIFEVQKGFGDSRQRTAAALSAYRLVRWCEGELPAYHRHAFRLALRELLHGVNPLYLVFDGSTPNPRQDSGSLAQYVEELMA
jgi:glycosyltransferase involved in cell wall biosynthesis